MGILQPAYKIISYICLTYKDIPDLPSDEVLPDEIPPSDDMLTDKVTIQYLHKGIRASFFSEMKNSVKLAYKINYIIDRFFVRRLFCHTFSQQRDLDGKVYSALSFGIMARPTAFLLQSPYLAHKVFFKDARLSLIHI